MEAVIYLTKYSLKLILHIVLFYHWL